MPGVVVHPGVVGVVEKVLWHLGAVFVGVVVPLVGVVVLPPGVVVPHCGMSHRLNESRR
ncbi:MAG: hypothetical protein R3E08_00780 [Thiotrichaceae bacterium]